MRNKLKYQIPIMAICIFFFHTYNRNCVETIIRNLRFAISLMYHTPVYDTEVKNRNFHFNNKN